MGKKMCKDTNGNLQNIKKIPLCPTCKNRHIIHEDGFEYLDCMLYIKKRDGKKTTTITNTDKL